MLLLCQYIRLVLLKQGLIFSGIFKRNIIKRVDSKTGIWLFDMEMEFTRWLRRFHAENDYLYKKN